MVHQRVQTSHVAAAAALVLLAGQHASAQFAFVPGTSREHVDLIHTIYRDANEGRFNTGQAWTLDARGTVAFSFFRDGAIIPAQAGTPMDLDDASLLFETLDAAFDDSDPDTNDREIWQGLIFDAFDRWAELANIEFEFRSREIPDGEDPLDNWDDSADWTDEGPLDGDLTVRRGDIRIGMRSIDGPSGGDDNNETGNLVSYTSPIDVGGTTGGDIILDAAEDWSQIILDDDGNPTFRFFNNAVARAIGQGIGLDSVCFRNSVNPDQDILMDPVLRLGFEGPQHDDIRGVQSLYGDFLEENDALTVDDATLVPYDPTFSVDNLTEHFNLSIDSDPDDDVFVFNIDDLEIIPNVEVLATPVGEAYSSGPYATPCITQAGTSASVYNLRIGLFDEDGVSIIPPNYDPNDDGVPDVDDDGFVDAEAAGTSEFFELTVGEIGTYYIVVDGLDQSSLGGPQIYDLTIRFSNSLLEPLEAIGLGPAIDQPAPFGHGVGLIHDLGFTGTRALYANIEDGVPNNDHIIFDGRDMPIVAFPGGPVFPEENPPALSDFAAHATGAAGSAIGREFFFDEGINQYHKAPAPEVPYAAGPVAVIRDTVFFSGVFQITTEAVYWAVWGLSDPNFFYEGLQNQIGRTATVLNNSWGGGGTSGDSVDGWAFDAASHMLGVTIVASAGNAGSVNNSDDCGDGGNIPGGLFRGSRTVGNPAASFNTISVGAVGRDYFPPDVLDPNDQPIRLVADWSSKGPIDTFNFDTITMEFNRRAGIDVVALGTGMLMEFTREMVEELEDADIDLCLAYFGHVENGIFLGNFRDPVLLQTPWMPEPYADDPSDDTYFAPVRGTSFAGPVVAGAVSLLQDVGLAQPEPFSIDPSLMRAMIMNSACKLPGWNNAKGSGYPAQPQDNLNGEAAEEDGFWEFISFQVENEQLPLDVAQGAGLLDAFLAYVNYTIGTTDVPETDPDVPTITPPEEDPIPPLPLPAEKGPASPVKVAAALAKAKDLSGDDNIRHPHADTTDPDLRPGRGDKGGGVDWDPRAPFKPPVGGPGGGGPGSTPPVEFDRFEVEPVGWDVGNIGQRFLNPRFGTPERAGYIDYIIGGLPFQDVFVATLVWDRNLEVYPPDFESLDSPIVGTVRAVELENLDLELYATNLNGEPFGEPIAFSRSTFNNVEHIFAQIPSTGLYLLRVRWSDTDYDLFANRPPAEQKFAVAWMSQDALGLSNLEACPNPFANQLCDCVSLDEGRSSTDRLMQVLEAFGSEMGDPAYSVFLDLNVDGRIDFEDLAKLLEQL